MTKKLIPIGDKIIIKPAKAEEKTKSGIVLPDSAKEKPQSGKVVAVGSGKLMDNGSRVAPEVKVGDSVLFSKYGGTDLKIDGEDLILLSERDILAIEK